jgi:hypothetical protein
MKVHEIIPEARKPKTPGPGSETPHDWNPAWQDLNWFKEHALQDGNRLAQRGYQLFIPRGTKQAKTPRDRRLDNLSSSWAYDDEGNLKPQYAKWEQGPKELSPTGQVDEAAPIIKTARANIPPGDNKPMAQLWTSTAIKRKDGTWTSDWGRWIADNHRGWLEMSSSYDRYEMRAKFPWDLVNRHFDAVHVRFPGEGFTYGWDVESTAWLNTEHLTLVGEVPVAQYGYGGNNEDY